MKTIAAAALCGALMATTALADIVVTTDGRRIEGEIDEDDAGNVVIKTRYGKITVSADKVAETIEKASPVEEYQDKYGTLKINPHLWDSATAHYELGLWCKRNKLHKEARERLAMAISLDPEHKKAHKALGHIMHDGMWVTIEHKMRSEGKVNVRGRWVSADRAKRNSGGGAPANGLARRSKGNISTDFITARTGEVIPEHSKWVSCTKCGGDGCMLSRDCLQCNGKGLMKMGAGYMVCNHCGGGGKENFLCPACSGTGRHLRGRYTFHMPPQVKLPHSGMMHCPKCSGSGYVEISDCGKCDGDGMLRGIIRFYVCMKCKGLGKTAFRCPWCGTKGYVRKRRESKYNIH